jgi:RimJ/RimL family protein N-acetyltransferase
LIGASLTGGLDDVDSLYESDAYKLILNPHMPHNLTFVSPTGRIKLLPQTEADDEGIVKIRTHPISLRYLRFAPTTFTLEDARLLREQRGQDPARVEFAIHEINNDTGSSTFIGATGIFNIDTTHGSCEVGVSVVPEKHRGGYATEALYLVLKYTFEERGLHRATFDTAEDNEGMRGWLEKVLGATLESRKRDVWKNLDGSYTSTCGYSILDWEWKERAKEALEQAISRRQKTPPVPI